MPNSFYRHLIFKFGAYGKKMAPRKLKSDTKLNAVDDAPVVFFLKAFTGTDSVVPSGVSPKYYELDASTNYTEILNTMDTSSARNAFNTDLLKSILDNAVCTQYSPQIVCFWCCHTFATTSVVLPVSYDAYKNVYNCEGNFCSPECALAYSYADNATSDSAKWNRHAMLGRMYGDLYKATTLSPAPPRTLLRMFGGPLDIVQYRDYIGGDNHIILSELPPVRLHFPSMNVQGPLRDIKKYVSLSTEAVEKASEQLRLKRSKPANTANLTLDMCIAKKGISV